MISIRTLPTACCATPLGGRSSAGYFVLKSTTKSRGACCPGFFFALAKGTSGYNISRLWPGLDHRRIVSRASRPKGRAESVFRFLLYRGVIVFHQQDPGFQYPTSWDRMGDSRPAHNPTADFEYCVTSDFMISNERVPPALAIWPCTFFHTLSCLALSRNSWPSQQSLIFELGKKNHLS